MILMDAITINRINNAHPRIKELLLNQYKEINKMLPKGVRLRFSHVFRTFAEQDALFAQRPRVTRAKGGQSIHNYGLAFDIVILLDKDNNGTFETAIWDGVHFNTVVRYFKSKGWEWGGDWKSFPDRPHFEFRKSNGTRYKWQELKSLIDRGQFVSNSHGFKYPLL
jgi:peptidoglycan L-alanyl-D-glutamate endopeptidase CwlK